eukprot:1694775-Prymnesium_polylepis.1
MPGCVGVAPTPRSCSVTTNSTELSTSARHKVVATRGTRRTRCTKPPNARTRPRTLRRIAAAGTAGQPVSSTACRAVNTTTQPANMHMITTSGASSRG